MIFLDLPPNIEQRQSKTNINILDLYISHRIPETHERRINLQLLGYQTVYFSQANSVMEEPWVLFLKAFYTKKEYKFLNVFSFSFLIDLGR